MSCDFAHQDGVYVLGALSPSERRPFEVHLAGCPDCAAALRQLAGLPGLLARVDASVLETAPSALTLPETLLPRLVAHVRRAQRRRRVLTGAVAAAALLVAGVAPVVVARSLSDEVSPASPRAVTAAGRTMIPLGGAPVRATITLHPVAWGTRLDLACTYAPRPDQYDLPDTATYVLVVTTRDGLTEQVGTWRSIGGRTMRLTAATSVLRKDIASVEVRTTSGKRVLELTT
ncbi:MAG: zf-HC2 domain-containing protein [Nocardioidaceae bacterium]